jgi:hypothetical protein
MSDLPRELRQIADECLRISEQTESPTLGEFYRRQAQVWRDLASKIELEGDPRRSPQPNV